MAADHDEIRAWAEDRNAWPARAKGIGDGDDPGIIRLDFPGYAEEGLEEISWEEFFEKFEERNLALVYEERTGTGEKSNFSKLVGRDSVEA